MGTRKQHAKVNIKDINIGFISLRVSTSVTDLGVVIDGELSMSAHVSPLTRTCFFQLRQIRAVRRSLDPNSTKTLVNSARLISGALWRDHITPVLRELHWLPVRERIRYKIATPVHKSMHNAAPSYLSELCTESSTVPGCWSLRSADEHRLHSIRQIRCPFIRCLWP